MKNPAALSGVLAILLVALSLYLLIPRNAEVPASTTPTDTMEPASVSVEARWLMAGEVFWARQMERIAESQDNTYEYLFAKLETLDRPSYDAWLAHMECPITSTNIPFDVQVSSLLFNCRPEYLDEFSQWFNAVSLANNHMGDAGGQAGLEETRLNLKDAGVQYYGHFDNSVTGDICEIVDLPVRLIGVATEEIASFPIAMCGYHNVFSLPTIEELAVINEYAEHFFTVVSPQQGAEYQASADNVKRETYRTMIDNGADLVVASHPHWVQNTEVYKGKLIMYSLGNFMFDQEWSAEVKRGVALDLTMNFDLNDSARKWLELECQEFKDDCLKHAKEEGLNKPEFSINFELVSVLHEGGQTFKASESIHRLNLERTNWAKTLEALR